MKQRTAKNRQVNEVSETSNIAVLQTLEQRRTHGLDPLSVSATICAFQRRYYEDYGIELLTSSDFAELHRVRMLSRGGPPQPAFDYSADDGDFSKAGFWIRGMKGGKTVALLAYRLYDVDRSFHDWVVSWQMWVHSRIGDDVSILPRPRDLPLSDLVSNLRGPVCYAGEMWLERSERSKGASYNVDHIMQFGHLIAWQLWRPAAVFGLAPLESARAGTMARTQWDTIEPGFLEWRRRPDCVSGPNEEMLVLTPEPRLKARVLDAQKRLF